MGIREFIDSITGEDERRRLRTQVAELQESRGKLLEYIRSRTNRLLVLMKTLPLRLEHLEEEALLELDPLGILADSFEQVLEHLEETNDSLRLARDEIRGILAAAAAGILVLDAEMRIVTWNAMLAKMFDIDDNAAGRKCFDFVCRRSCPPSNCIFRSIVTAKRPVQVRNWGIGDRQYDLSGSPVRDRFGDVIQVVVVFTDITERNHNETTLRENEEMYRLLFENASDLIQSVAPDGSLRYVNSAWLAALGYTREEASSLSVFDIIHPDERDACRRKFVSLMSGKGGGLTHTTFLTRDGRTLDVEGNVSCVTINGSPAATCGIFRLLAEHCEPVAAP